MAVTRSAAKSSENAIETPRLLATQHNEIMFENGESLSDSLTSEIRNLKIEDSETAASRSHNDNSTKSGSRMQTSSQLDEDSDDDDEERPASVVKNPRSNYRRVCEGSRNHFTPECPDQRRAEISAIEKRNLRIIAGEEGGEMQDIVTLFSSVWIENAEQHSIRLQTQRMNARNQSK